MRRQVFNFLAAASLLLCVGALALWVRSYRIVDKVGRFGPVKAVHASSFNGVLTVGLYGTFPEDTMGRSLPFSYYVRDRNGAPFLRDLLRFKAGLHVRSGFGYVGAPDWFVALVLSMLPLRWAWLHAQANRRASHGHCTECGYDLRASPGRCPECGSASGRGKPAAA
jgi:hypothetical protein